MPCVETMITYLREPVVHNAFYKKYAGKKFLKGMFESLFHHLVIFAIF